jgi:hypothetical protein
MKNALFAAVFALSSTAGAGAYAQESWSPGQYPAYCSAAAKNYKALPALTRDKSYQSPDEPVLNYNRIDSDEPSVMNEVSNAVNAFGSMVGYAGAMANAYDKAAKAYWAHFDRTGTVDPDLEREYAYWVWRRWRFSDEVGAIRAGYYQTGAGAAKFLADSLGSTFATPQGAGNMKTAQLYDWNKYSECSLKNAETLDAALEYEIFLDNYPEFVERVPYVQEEIGAGSLTDEQKGKLVIAMRQAREYSTFNPPKSGLGASREQALEMIASVSAGTSAVLSDFIETLGWRRDDAVYKKDPYALFGKNGGVDYSMSIKGAASGVAKENTHRAAMIAGVFMGQNEQSFPPGLTQAAYKAWLDGGPAPAQFSAMPVQDAAMCALERWEDGARYVYEQAPEIVEAAAEEKVFLDEYCTMSKAANYRSAANRAASRTKICLGDDAYRAAFWACASGKPLDAAQSMIAQRLSFYPTP